MKVLTIHNHHANKDDFCWGIEGELAITPLVCDSPGCGCDRSHCGLNSGRASTTLMVREVDLDFDDLTAACIGFLQTKGFAECADCDGELKALARDLVAQSAEVAGGHHTDTVLRPRFDHDRHDWHYEVAT